ncbi:MAG: murein transglycosylase A [Magnetospirillum sp. WYHS-4]
MPEPHLSLTPVSYSRLAGWETDRHGEALAAFRRSCPRLDALSSGRPLDNGGAVKDGGPDLGRADEWQAACKAAAGQPVNDDAGARRFFETWFSPFLVADNDREEGLFTGYYEAELKGSRKKHGPYRHPVHARPKDLVTADLGRFKSDWKGQELNGRLQGGHLVPYASRNEIVSGFLDGKAQELFWVDDPIELFFLHVQGSGRISLDDGRTVRVGYAGRNGHPYRAIGAELADRGVMRREDITMPAIRAWLAANPTQAAGLLNANPSYVFFRTVEGDGPIGAQGVVLTPGRSLAVDKRFLPYGAPLWLETSDPLDPSRPLRRLLVAQDTGGAITGPVRGDVFWGHGPEAMARAGHMKQKGRYFLLLPKRPQAIAQPIPPSS